MGWKFFNSSGQLQTEAPIADNAITLAKIEDGTQGDILYYGASGVPARLGYGTSGHFLKTQGASANPTWAAASPTAIGCRVFRNSSDTDTFTNGTTAAVVWQDSRYHVSGASNANMWDSGTQPQRVYARVAGTYLIIANWRWSSDDTDGSRHARIKLNGDSSPVDIALDYRDAHDDDKITLSTIYQLADGDYVGLYLMQNSGSTLPLLNEANGATEFMVQKIADTITDTFYIP